VSNNTVCVRQLTTNLRYKAELNTPVIFDTELWRYSNGITVCIRSRMRCRITVSNIFGKCWLLEKEKNRVGFHTIHFKRSFFYRWQERERERKRGILLDNKEERSITRRYHSNTGDRGDDILYDIIPLIHPLTLTVYLIVRSISGKIMTKYGRSYW